MALKKNKISLLVCLAAAMILVQAVKGDERSGVKNYGDSMKIRLTAAEEVGLAAMNQVARGFQGYRLHLDPRLVLVARDLAREIQSDLSRQSEIMSSDHTLKLMSHYGVYETSNRVRSFTYVTNGDIESQVRLYFSSGTSTSTHLGIGSAPPDGPRPGVEVVILSEKRADLMPFPRRVALPSSYTLQGRLVNTSRGLTPAVMLTDPAGNVMNLKINSSGDSFSVSLTFDGEPGTYRVEVVASGGGKSQVSALLAVDAGAGSRSNGSIWEISGYSGELHTETEAEAAMTETINQVRVKGGLKPLKADPRLARMARDHSLDMKANHFSGHLSPSRGGVPERARAHGLAEYQVKENVAISPSLVQAMNNLLQSPVHRASILGPELTHLGVGIVFDDSNGTRHYFITQEFARLK